MARVCCLCVLIVWLLAGAGCDGTPRAERQIWEQVKIGEIAPTPNDKPARAKFLATVRMEIQVIELPAENIDRLDGLWQMLSAKPIRLSSYNAFSANSFRLKFGRTDMWEQIEKLLGDLDAQKVARTVLTVTDNDTSDFLVASVPVPRTISFVANNLAIQTVNVEPGAIVLRLRAERIPWARGVRKIIGYPTYTLPINTAIPQLQQRAHKNEFYFASAAFALQMGPGDLLVLGPDRQTGEQVTLGGIFFNNPQGSLFFNPDKRHPPEQKPAVRLYVLVCTGISD